MLKFLSIDSSDALKMAIQCKRDMKDYYEKASSLVKNDDAEAILKGLAEKEEKHRIKLIKTYSKLSHKKILYLNLGKKHKLNTLLRCGDDPNQAIRDAKQNETEIKKFFLAVSRRLYESEIRQIFRELVLEEEQHIALLESSFVEPLTLDQESVENDENAFKEFASTNNNAVRSW